MKGDIEEVINKCTKIEYKNEIKDINDNKWNNMHAIVDELTEDGMKVLAVAYKKGNEYILLGYLAFFDVPKSTAYTSIEKLHNLNIDIRILTGDAVGTSVSIRKKLGINYENVMTGKMLEKLNKNELYVKVEKTTVFAELTPKQKAKIIEILQENGHLVGLLAD